MNTSRRLFFSLLVGSALTGCTQNGDGSDAWSQFSKGFTDAMHANPPGAALGLPGLGGGGAAAHAHPSLDQVGLANIMPVYDDRLPLSRQFPHVALTVLQVPPNWSGTAMQQNPFGGGFGLIRGCWTLSAVVWSSETTSKTVGPFDWCGPEDVKIQPAAMAGMGVLRIPDMDYSTGPRRTNGPRPPETIFPEDRHDYKSFVPTTLMSQNTGSALWLMYANVMYGMGSTPGKNGDYRIWIASINA
jgi:hypothetical protein